MELTDKEKLEKIKEEIDKMLPEYERLKHMKVYNVLSEFLKELLEIIK